jgi:23S rRNA-/tRNA-specific pseudouridylate synthase
MIQEGDVVLIKDMFALGKHNPNASKSIKDKQKEHIDREKVKGRIIDETTDRLVRNKPAGIVIHESAQHYKDLCMHDYLDEYLKISQHNNVATKQP